MGGLQAARAIREYDRGMGRSAPVLIVAMTAFAGNEERQVCLEAGMDDYLTKPIKPARLLQLLNELSPCPTKLVGTTTGDSPEAAAPKKLPGEPGNATPVFARDELLERLGGRAEMIPRFVGLFCKGFLTQMEGLVSALAAGDADEVRRHAHAIKGSTGNIAALRMHRTAAMMEKAAKEGDLTEAPQRLATLQEEYREFTEAAGASGCELTPMEAKIW
jgi:CheY-like chemotaxis protein